MFIKLIHASAVPPSPDYVVDGITQSHWLAENAVVTGNAVNSVTDSSGLENLLEISPNIVSFNASGWSGDGGPAIIISENVLNEAGLKANGWASRISGIRTPFTITAKLKILSIMHGGVAWGFNSYMDHTILHLSPQFTASTTIIGRSIVTHNGSDGLTSRTGDFAIDNLGHNWYVEYDGSNHRFWIDGVEISYTETISNTNDIDATFDVFNIGGWNYNFGAYSLALAEMHIYLAAFAEPQRTILINDLQNRRGL
jgi:hypothetical protein